MRELKQEDSPISDTFPGFLIVNRTPQQKGPPFSASSPGLWPLTFPQKPQSQALASPPQGSASLEPSHPSFLPRPHQRHSRGTSRGRGGERPPPAQAGSRAGNEALGETVEPGLRARPAQPGASPPPAGLPPAPRRRPHAAPAAAKHVPRRGRSHRRCRSPGAPCGRLGHGGQRRAAAG